jgi:septal ring factor EnvC (AmiA/AmiB activator)
LQNQDIEAVKNQKQNVATPNDLINLKNGIEASFNAEIAKIIKDNNNIRKEIKEYQRIIKIDYEKL